MTRIVYGQMLNPRIAFKQLEILAWTRKPYPRSRKPAFCHVQHDTRHGDVRAQGNSRQHDDIVGVADTRPVLPGTLKPPEVAAGYMAKQLRIFVHSRAIEAIAKRLHDVLEQLPRSRGVVKSAGYIG